MRRTCAVVLEYRHGMVLIALCVLGLYLLWYGMQIRKLEMDRPLVAQNSSNANTAFALPAAEPQTLRIPKVGISAAFEGPLGLNPDQTVMVPESFTEVGWYQYGPTPGALGPAVVLGHVDSRLGPAVFFSLGQLSEGDEIFIDRNDGTTAKFLVTELRRAAQDSFPTALVYGDIDHAGLRLITCSGRYDRGVQRYSHNLIVFAKLVP